MQCQTGSMASLVESYEQQYSNLTAEIVSLTGTVPNLSGSEKQSAISNVEHLLEETKELLEQMELEVRGLPPRDRQKYNTRWISYTAELGTLEKEFRKARIAFSDHVRSRDELLGDADERHACEDQRSRLLDNSERIERSGHRLEQGYKTCLESEEVGSQVLQDLHNQRETMQNSRRRLQDTSEVLGKSSRVLSGMMRRFIQNRILLVGMAILMVIIIGLVIYFTTRR